jgi:Fe-Mn family superoxide dismutase
MKHKLPSLPYDNAALGPHIDAQTMVLHHAKHHASYVTNLNAPLEQYPELHERTALWLLLNLREVPEKIRAAVRNNAGGHVNHSLFWRAMSQEASGAPAGPLAAAIDRDFGSLEQFKTQFAEAGGKLFGSGWVWLVRGRQDGGRLQVYTTAGHDNPLTRGYFPILVNDVWEHAYYLKYENRRSDYLDAWWTLANWKEAARRFTLYDDVAAQEWGGEGGLRRSEVVDVVHGE